MVFLSKVPSGTSHKETILDLQAKIWNVRFQVLTAAIMKFRIVFWDVLPC
jgi:hypothetical protein